MPRITMIKTKLMSRAVAWGLAILLVGAVPWPAIADYPGKYLEICYSYEAYKKPNFHLVKKVWVTSEAGINGTNGTVSGSEGYKTMEYFSGPNNSDITTYTEIDNDTKFEILYIRKINELMDDEWIPGAKWFTKSPLTWMRNPYDSAYYCQVMWKD